MNESMDSANLGTESDVLPAAEAGGLTVPDPFSTSFPTDSAPTDSAPDEPIAPVNIETSIEDESAVVERETLESILTTVNRIATAADLFNARSTAQESIIEKLHDANQQLRVGEAEEWFMPVRLALVQLYGDLQSYQVSLSQTEELREVSSKVTGFVARVEQLLDSLDLVPLGTKVGDVFDARQQVGIKSIATEDASLANTVAVVERMGFRKPNRPKPEAYSRVSVYRHAPVHL